MNILVSFFEFSRQQIIIPLTGGFDGLEERCRRAPVNRSPVLLVSQLTLETEPRLVEPAPAPAPAHRGRLVDDRVVRAQQGRVDRSSVAGRRSARRSRAPRSLCVVDIADVDFEEGVNHVEGESVENRQSHVGQDQQGDQHGDETGSKLETNLRIFVIKKKKNFTFFC